MNAQQLQQQGNAALFRGQFDNAIQYYRQSMLISSQDVSVGLQDHFHDDNDSESMVDVARDIAATPTAAQPVMESISLDLQQIIMTTSCETISSHNIFDLFDRAFQNLPNASAAVSSVVCIYNIALTHHTRSMLRTDNSAHHFQRAHHFYRLAWKALLSCSQQKQVHPSDQALLQEPTLLPVMLALLNNMGHIACHFWEKADVEAALHGMLKVLPYYLEHHVANLCHPDVQFFYSYRSYEYVDAMNHAPSA